MSKMKRIFFVKLLFLPLLFTSLAFLGRGRALAADDINVCKPYDASWKLTIWKAIDVQNTTENLGTAVANSLFAKVYGKNTNDAVICENKVLNLRSNAPRTGGAGGFGNAEVCGVSNTPEQDAVCDEIMDVTKTAYMYKNKSSDLLAVDTSLAGISNRIQNTVLRDPIAVDLAYYWKSQVAKIPFVGKTYAATLGENQMAIINAALGVWKACRDISLGFIAVILMYTGLMIVMRKKVNPQLVVTVQYAIPKIIIGLILILFSYPIGAAITGLSWGLFRSSTEIVVNAIYPGSSSVTFANQVMLALVIGALKMGFFAGLGFMLVIFVAVATIVMLIIVNVKALIIYIKMVFSTIIAPFEFALGTVPGSEDRIKDWFLRMAKYGLTIFAMGLIIPASLSVAYEVLVYYSFSCVGSACNVETAGLGTFMMVAAPLIIVILGFSLALKMEDSIDKMLFGGKSGKGGKR